MQKDNNLISLKLVSDDNEEDEEEINHTILVIKHISCVNLMILIGEELKKIVPNFEPEKYYFLQIK